MKETFEITELLIILKFRDARNYIEVGLQLFSLLRTKVEVPLNSWFWPSIKAKQNLHATLITRNKSNINYNNMLNNINKDLHKWK